MTSGEDPLCIPKATSVFRGSLKILKYGRRAQHYTSNVARCGLPAITTASSTLVFIALYIHHMTTVGTN